MERLSAATSAVNYHTNDSRLLPTADQQNERNLRVIEGPPTLKGPVAEDVRLAGQFCSESRNPEATIHYGEDKIGGSSPLNAAPGPKAAGRALPAVSSTAAVFPPKTGVYGHPLQLRIPRTEMFGSTFGRHTEFIVELNDSGETFTVARRFRAFCELHRCLLDEMSQQTISTTLPPKKLFGNLDPVFVETRRQALEAYLQRLLSSSGVVNSDILWSFLEADSATVTVARLLCEGSSVPLEDRIAKFHSMAVEQSNRFRLSHPRVLEAVLALV